MSSAVNDVESATPVLHVVRVEPERPGSGLGLAIVRAIVTAHGGTIWVEETAGGGTAVVFDLPVEEEVQA